MRLSTYLCKQHIGWHFKKFWEAKGARKVINTKVDEILAQRNIPVCKPEDILKIKPERLNIEVVGYKPKPVIFDQTHPDWHNKPLLTYKDNNVLLEGLTQAKVLTRTVEIKDGLPETFTLKDDDKSINKRVKEIIMSCNVFDAEQKKLPKRKDPARPAFNFPRIYGITQRRASQLLLTNLLNLIETTSDPTVVKERHLIDNLLFSYYFARFENLIQFQLKSDILLTSAKLLSPITNERTDGFNLPDIFPIKPTITLTEENIYKTQNIYPINVNMPKSHPHTVFIHYDKTEVGNLFEEEVTQPQIFGRSLLKTFTVAASYARQKYGDNVKDLSEPVTVQCVHTDGRMFHFGVFQLNTLEGEDGNVKNLWFQTGLIPLFESCGYVLGKPTLEGYNSEVIKYLNVFYNNV